ncbi:putative dehydrogenase [Rhodobium orientis]|nr:Gfo/Idh/MocA family oxidoreductase [Rhodobium orientis]MBB4301411.1 putative dehydrogenase [Rhodobium orientis]
MDRSVRWGVLGFAGIAKMALIPAIQSAKNASLVAVASRRPTEVKPESMGLPGIRVLDYDALINDPDIDAVYIPLPNSLHAEWAGKALDAGKAVLCEKPLAMNADEAIQLLEQSKKVGRPMMEGFMYRFHPQHARVKQLIAEDAIGDIQEVRAHLCVDMMSPPDASNVRFIPELGGGALLDMGCYVVSVCRMVFGEEPLTATVRWHVDPRFGVDTNLAAILEFAEGRKGIVSCSFSGNSQGSYTVVGNKGSIEVPRGIIPGLDTRVSETLVILCDGDGGRQEETIAAVDQYSLMVQAFSEAILEGKPAPLPLEDSVANMRVLDAMARSAHSGTSADVS